MTGKSDGAVVVRAMLARLRAPDMTPSWWLLVIAITTGTNLLDFFSAAEPDAARSAFFIIAAVIRIALVFWLTYALLRRLAGEARPMRLTMAFGRLVLFMIGIVILLGLCSGLAAAITGADARDFSSMLLTYILYAMAAMLLVRLYAWQAALSVGDRSLGPGGAWTRLAPHAFPLATGYLPIACIAVLHAYLTRLALGAGDDAGALVTLAIVDGIVSGVQLALGCALAVTAYRLAKGEAEALRGASAVA